MPKILLIRLSSIGDIVLTSPIIRVLNQQLKAELHFVCKAQFAEMLKPNPYLTTVHSLQSNLSQTIELLKKERFDFVVDLHKNMRSTRIIRGLGVPHYTFDKLNWEKWLMVNFKIDKLGNQHIVDRYFDGLKALGIDKDHEGLDFFPSNDPPSEAFQALSKTLSTPFLTLAIGAAHATKQMPMTLLEGIIATSNWPIALLGGKNEMEAGAALNEKFKTKTVNFCGKISISNSAQLIAKSLALITPDTGMMHIGAALKKPVVAVWGNTIPAFGMYPYYPKGAEQFENIFVPNLSCRPCSKIGKKKCPKGHFKCMNDLKANTILQAVEKLIS